MLLIPHFILKILLKNLVTMRFQVVIFISVILPLSLFRNVTSLSKINSITVLFYGVFVLRMLAECIPRILDCNWNGNIRWWRQEGLLNRFCLCIWEDYMSVACLLKRRLRWLTVFFKYV